MPTLQTLLPAEIFSYLLVFSRIGTTISVLPGFGESYVSPRIRLLLALTITVVLTPVVSDRLPALPASPLSLLLLVGGEGLVGLFMGSIARVLLSTLATGGAILAFLIGLANAQLFNPLLSDQGALPGVFLSVMGLLMIFVTDTHHLMLMALLDGYSLFQPGAALPLGDFANLMAQVVAGSFRIGMQIAAPFLMYAIVFYAGMGLLARLMVQMPIFFVALPVQILLGLFTMLLTLPAVLLWFLNYYQTTFSRILLPG
ncbi:MAG: flagellar biosynthetic protein FliR [Alphaproteobacteria bacterium]|nr:flagellar biosynthetic protein FliR [Alphaproteobacteria bacterium]